MGINDYHFVTRWRVPASIEDVNAILSDPLDLPRWWPAVYLEASEIEPPDASGSGQSANTRRRAPSRAKLGLTNRLVYTAAMSCDAEPDR